MVRDGSDKRRAYRVLVADDERQVRNVIGRALRERGCTVEVAAGGREAFQLLMQRHFDVLVVDLKMADMDGMTLVREARRVWPWLGIVIVSAHIDDSTRETAAELGVERVLHKGVGFSTLAEEVMAEAGTRADAVRQVYPEGMLPLIRDHLRILTRLGPETISLSTLTEALVELVRTLADVLPADAVGVIMVDEKRPIFLVDALRGLSSAFEQQFRSQVLARYALLSGDRFDESFADYRFVGAPRDEAGPEDVRGLLTVPVLTGGEIYGLVAIGATDARSYASGDVSTLCHAVNHLSGVFGALRRMHALASHDPLTGLFNRARFDEELERAWMLGRRYGHEMAVVCMDIDFFKDVNDAYGHAKGDEVLRRFGEVLRDVARASDILGRRGGDEFVAILPRADEQEARAFGTRVLARTREHLLDSGPHGQTVSIGIASSRNLSLPASSWELLDQADRAMYSAKRGGRNRLCIWPESTPVAAEPVPVSCSWPQGNDAEETPGHILVVDDEPHIRSMMEHLLKAEGYTVAAFDAVAAAVKSIAANPGLYDVLLADLNLREESGLDLLNMISVQDDSIVRIVVTGHATVDSAVRSLREGAYDFIEKPIIPEHFLALLRRAMEYRRLRRDHTLYRARLEALVRERSTQLSASLDEARKSYDFTLEALVGLLDARESTVGVDSLRAREMAVALGRNMGLHDVDLQSLGTGALLHDIGQIGVPDSILLKPGPLQDAEWQVLRQHPDIGFRILRVSPYLNGAAEIVRSHHEHFDGSSYPRGLRGSEICMGARIFSVVDAYEAMRSGRVYRPAMDAEQACEEVCRHQGTQFDPDVVAAFLACREEMDDRLLSAS